MVNEPPIIYVLDIHGLNHELVGDRPYRKDGVAGVLKDAPTGVDIEVFLGDRWIQGVVRKPPTNFEFVVSCISFESEPEVWKALEHALSVYPLKPRSPIPWLKITPPSRRPGKGAL